MLRFAVPLLLVVSCCSTQQSAKRPVAAPASQAYALLIDPLLTSNLQTDYYEDGASDATVTCPLGATVCRPAAEVLALSRHLKQTTPTLIACLSDTRTTNATFRSRRVPVGYVCLDILLARYVYEPVAEKDCADDGLGACIRPNFYFRPDDYSCQQTVCIAKPNVLAVQHTWLRAFNLHKLRYSTKFTPEGYLQ